MASSEPNTASSSRSLLGRGQVLRHLCALIRTALSTGSPSTVLLTGAPGVGKSRVLDAMLLTLSEQFGGMRSFRLRGEPLERLAPWHGVRQLVEAMTGHVPSEVIDELTARMNAPLEPCPNVGERIEKGVEQRLALSACFGKAFHELTSKQIVAVVIDDAHAMDVASLEICNTLLLRCSEYPLMLVLTGWEPMVETAANLFSNPQIIYEELTPLDPVSVRQVVDDMAGDLVEALPTDILDLVANHSRGNPLFAEEMIHDMRQKMNRFGSDGFDPGAFALPLTLEDLYRTRVEKLPGPARNLLNRCALGGMAFGLATTYTDASDGSQSPLDRCTEARVLENSAVRGWQIVNGSLVEAARESCSSIVEVGVHDEAAAWHERQRPLPTRDVAFHCVRGSRLADSVAFWEQEAAVTMARGDFRSAAEALGVASAITFDPQHKCRLTLDRSACLSKVHEWNRVTEMLGGLPSRVVRDDPSLGADHTFLCAEAINSGGAVGSDEETLQSLFQESLHYAEQVNDPFRQLRALSGLAALAVTDDPQRAQATLDKALAIQDEHSVYWPPLAIAVFRVRRAMRPSDDLRAVVHHLLHDTEPVLRADVQVRLLEEWVDMEITDDQWDAAALLLEELVQQARIIGNPLSEAEAMYQRAHVCAMLGQPEQQERLLERAMALAVRLGHTALIDACQREHARTEQDED